MVLMDPLRVHARESPPFRAVSGRNFEVADLPRWEAWAYAVAAVPKLLALQGRAWAMRPKACRTGDWHALVDLLLDLDLPVPVYDLAIDVLHDAASMPCGCVQCVAIWEGRTIRAERSRPRKGSAYDLLRAGL